MRSYLFLLLIVLLPVCAIGQDRGYDNRKWDNNGEAGSALSVFSENGDRFFLVINGIKQNANPQTKVRVEGLPQVTNEVQIIFDDNQTRAIQKKIAFADPVEGKAINLVLKIVRVQNGYPKLCFHKSTELQHDYRPEQGEYVMAYGQDKMQQKVMVNTPPPPPPAPIEMSPKVFGDMKQSIMRVSFEDTKLSTAKAVLSSNYMSADQVLETCRLFSFEDSKLDFAKFAYSKTVDPNNYFKVGNAFNFSTSRDELNNFITANNK